MLPISVASVQVNWLQILRFGGAKAKECNPRMWEAGGKRQEDYHESEASLYYIRHTRSS